VTKNDTHFSAKSGVFLREEELRPKNHSKKKTAFVRHKLNKRSQIPCSENGHNNHYWQQKKKTDPKKGKKGELDKARERGDFNSATFKKEKNIRSSRNNDSSGKKKEEGLNSVSERTIPFPQGKGRSTIDRPRGWGAAQISVPKSSLFPKRRPHAAVGKHHYWRMVRGGALRKSFPARASLEGGT